MRRLVAEAKLSVDDLVAPLFVKDGIDAPEPIVSMPGVVQHTQESLRKEVHALADLGVPAVILFGIPATKDARGSGADDPDGVVQVALRSLRDEVGDSLVLMADDCLDEYTDHGHCGLLTSAGEVDNDATLERYASIAIAQASAGADVIAPSGMMDGQVGAIRAALDETGNDDIAILAYAAKYASALYGPFRDAAECAPQFGDRRGYQMDPPNAREALDETALDIGEGADMVMVKPALAVPRRRASAARRLRRPRVGVPRERRVLDAQGGCRSGLARRRCRGTRGGHLDQARRRRLRAHLLRTRAGRTPLVSSLFTRAQACIPGGVDSPVRSFASVGGDPFFVARAEGAHLFDTDGRRYVDYVQSWGASILGHAYPAVVEAVQRAAAAGTSYGAPTEREVELAEAIAARVPSVDKVRLVSSGTEAAMTAVRLARGVTGRAKVLKFAGCYHGHVDALLVAAGSGVATLGLPGSAGVTDGTVADTVVVPYNNEGALDEAFERYGADLAAVIVEPVAANMGLVPPLDDFLTGLERRCHERGTLLICDEVITGFRLGPAGAQGRYGITPDLSMFGKVVGGGLPLAAVAGTAGVMDHLAPIGPVYQAGTLSGNPVATAAGLAVLQLLDDQAYATLEAKATHFADGLAKALPDARITRVGTLTGLFFADHPVCNYEEAQRADHDKYARLFHHLLDAGHFLAPSGYETLFVSLAHTDEDIDATLSAAASFGA